MTPSAVTHLRLAIELPLTGPDRSRCLQAHRQSPHLAVFRSMPKVNSLDAGSRTPAVHRVLAPVSSTVSSAFPKQRMGRLPAFVLRTTSRRRAFRGCRYSLMFRPPSLLTPRSFLPLRIPTAGQPGLLHPGLLCFVTSA